MVILFPLLYGGDLQKEAVVLPQLALLFKQPFELLFIKPQSLKGKDMAGKQ